MSWFVCCYFGAMLLLALWLAFGIFASLRERIRYRIRTPEDAFAERNAGHEFTLSNVREAFELYLSNFEPRPTDQSR